MTRFYVLKSLLTLEVLNIGATPLSDLKAQTVDVCTNVGLLAALLLTTVIPIVFDAAPAPQMNAEIVTDPPWVGQFYFSFASLSAFMFTVSTVSSIIVITLLGETNSSHEARWFLTVASEEANYPVQTLLIGATVFCITLLLWMSIDLFALNVSQDCADDGCGPFPYAFLSCILLSGLVVMHFSWKMSSLCAKLYKAHAKFSPSSDSTHLDECFLDLGAKEVWPALHKYIASAGKTANLVHFQEYLLMHQTGNKHALGLTSHLEKLSEKLFAARMAQVLQQDHAATLKELEALKARDPCFESYPADLEHTAD